MSKYTTEVRFICEMQSGLSESTGYNDVEQVLTNSHAAIIGSYPIFDETYRATLNKKILRHFYTREICEETVGLWKLRLNARMNEIMPYYNKLYSSELLTFNPLYDVDYSSAHNRAEESNGTLKSENSRNDNTNRQTASNSTGTSSSNSETQSVSQSDTNNRQADKYSDTPQGSITGLEEGTYLTNARLIDANSASTGLGNSKSNGSDSTSDKTQSNTNEAYNTVGERNDENTVNSVEDYLEHVSGKRGGSSYSAMLKEYRETFLNIDMQIINDLNDLFFGLWD